MKVFIFLTLFVSTYALAGITYALAGITCQLTDFEVEVYDHGGTYIHGKLNGVRADWIPIHVAEKSETSNRRLSIALAAQMSSRTLRAYFKHINSCSEYTNYMSVTGLRLGGIQ